ncbi:MAG: polysaccharide deacetylase family protein [Flavobacteriales bacterium]|nr:polysaccharide deacetylase family protein [Flavobacteriales bacterium]
MLTHRITFWPFMFVHLIAIACWTLGYIGGWVPILSVVLHLALLTYGSLTPDAGFFIPHSVNLEKGTLALTYDDGPVPTHTEAILDLLKSEGVRATFFCIGDRVLKHPELAKRIVAEGHVLGVHTQGHSWRWGFMGKREALSEIERCVESIRSVTGKTPKLFRPPFGATSPNTAYAIHKSGLIPVAWDLRTFDTNAKEPSRLIEKCLARMGSATNILMHDPVPAALLLTKALIQRAKERGTRLVTVDPPATNK